MTAGASMLAMTRSRPPHCRQVSISMAKTRFRRWTQVRPRWRSAADAGPGWLAGPGPGHDPRPIEARRREYAVVPGQVGAGLGDQRGEPRNKVFRLDKIAGSDFGQPKAGPKGGGQDARSNITCVVPSR